MRPQYVAVPQQARLASGGTASLLQPAAGVSGPPQAGGAGLGGALRYGGGAGGNWIPAHVQPWQQPHMQHGASGSAAPPPLRPQRQAPQNALPLPWPGGVPASPDGWAQVRRATSRVFGNVPGEVAKQQTFYCPFCMENHHVTERIYFQECGKEDHGVCKECMGGYIRGLVADGGGNIKCYSCKAPATAEEVRILTDAETFAKYERFRMMREDPRLRECPNCSTFCKPVVSSDGDIQAEMLCENCGEEFCYYHSNAHKGRSCTDYRMEQAKQERLAEKGALRGTKVCPVCGIRTEKTSGCNHMTCSQCQTHWCWICQKEIDKGANGVTDHYAMGGPCGGRLFEDINPASPFYYILPCMVIPVKLVAVIIFVLSSLTVVLWFPIILILATPCHRCSITGDCWKCMLIGAFFLASIPFLLFLLAWSMVAGFLFLWLTLCGAGIEHVIYLARAPVDAIAPCIVCYRRMWRRCKPAQEPREEIEDEDVESEVDLLEE